MRIICVDTNVHELALLMNRVEQVKPNAAIDGFRTPTEALTKAKESGCDVLLTEVHLNKDLAFSLPINASLIMIS